MAKETMYVIQPSFAGGEISREVASRIDFDKYQNALLSATNCYIRPYGSVYRRGGSLYVGSAKYADKATILQAFHETGGDVLLEIGDRYIRIWRDDVYTGIELETPYVEEDLARLRFCQSADVMYIASGTHPVMKLSRYSKWVFLFSEMEITRPYFDASFSGVVNRRGLVGTRVRSSIKKSGVVVIDSNKKLFSEDMVGAGICLIHQIPSQTVSAENTATSDSVLVGKGWKVLTHGTWTGEITIECSEDNLTWKKYRTYKSNRDFNASESGTVDRPLYLRIVMNTTGDPEGKADLTAFPYEGKGTAIIIKFENRQQVKAKIIDSFASAEETEDYMFSSWSKLFGYPRAVGFFQDRFVLAGTKAQPYMMWMSRTGDYPNFSVEKVAGTLTDDSAVALSFVSREQCDISHILPAADLLVFTTGNEWIVSGADVITPTKANPKVQTSRGSSDISPLQVGNRCIFVQRRGVTVRDIGYSFDSDGYDGTDLTLLAKHLTKNNKIVSMAYMQEPDSRLYFVMEDGTMNCLSYMQEQKVYAWSQLKTEGRYLSVCRIEEEDEDRVYVLVERDGVRYIERMAGMPESDDPMDYVMTDHAYRFDGEESSVFSAETLKGKTIAVLADGQFHKDIKTDENGEFTLPCAAKKVIAGLPYETKIETCNVEVNTSQGTLQGRKKKIAASILRLTRSLGGDIGISGGHKIEIKYNEFGDNPVLLYSGDKEVTMPNPGFETKGRVVISTSEPYPFALSSLIREVVVAG